MSERSGAGSGTGTDPTVAVTGAAGYIGSRVLSRLELQHPSWELVGLDNQYRGQVESVGDVDIAHVDVRDRERLERVLEGADVVLHMAALSGVDDCADEPDLAYEVNVTGTNNVARFCQKRGVALGFPFSMAVLGDPPSFPITAALPRDPLNWYGKTKHVNETSIEAFAAGSFPAHLFMKSNLYGDHTVDGTTVSKPTVINYFASRAAAGKSLTVYEPGSQARNFVHVNDVAQAWVRSAERLLEQQAAGATGATTYEIASDEDPSVMEIAETVQSIASEEFDTSIDVELVENPRGGETMVESFEVDWSRAKDELGWEPSHTVDSSVRDLLAERL